MSMSGDRIWDTSLTTAYLNFIQILGRTMAPKLWRPLCIL